jgi:hypothetical protein
MEDGHEQRCCIPGLSLSPAPYARTGIGKHACSRGGIFKRIVAAVERSRQRRIEQEAGRFIAKHGGRITDDVERQLNGHFSGGGFPPYRPQRAFRPFAGPCGS